MRKGCRDCGEEHPERLTTCPNCGRELEPIPETEAGTARASTAPASADCGANAAPQSLDKLHTIALMAAIISASNLTTDRSDVARRAINLYVEAKNQLAQVEQIQ